MRDMTNDFRGREKIGNRKKVSKEDISTKINNLLQRYEIRSYEEIYNAFEEPNIIGVIRAKKISWPGHILWSNTNAKKS